ncbi:asparagine synthase (glutamine-hydrolyzing) [Limnochorda pilosa]|uniref:asparagine synthase (glutamine-hydrolyzing) n=1 Tax=Limnochorda pilosa TaxID=1555112 RepID=A0A0K2SQX7_LIMPI|nr:asparagine synthase (glutamine-hydrolyzing) [Limnochorda pilosa]BAS29209.1 asparagine synthase [Limnochorda pilosa]
MCGIAGWVQWDADLTREAATLEAMCEPLSCRGPDDKGAWLSPHAAVGHRRLVVVDPAGGAQPMTLRREGQTLVLTYNGELYNTAELRAELEARGHAFRGHSDTEVLLAAYAEWGPDCLPRLNGIFAFGVWDEARQHLFLARDRLGVKPLFFAERPGLFLFASELKALLAHPVVEPVVDREGLAEVLVMGPARTPGHGVFRGVAELKPGCWLALDQDGLRTGTYWRLESRPHPHDLETTARRVHDLLEDTVQRQLVSDVPVCTLLSGGLDSSALTAFAAAAYRREGRALRTFSVDYVGNDRHFHPDDFQPTPDAPWVRRVSGFLGTDHREVLIDTARLVDALTAAVRARDLPGMADVDASLYLFSREIKREATVALSGECADEVFGGYPWFRREEDIRSDTFPWARRLETRLRLLAPEVVAELKPQAYLERRYREALTEVPRLPGEEPGEARMREIMYLTLTRWMPVLLDRKDRMSMAVGLEVRVPYCDHRLVEYVWNIPWSMKRAGGVEKGILRRALRGVLPPDVLERRKSPYPKTHNPDYLEAVRGWLLDVLADPGAPILALIDRKAVTGLARDDTPDLDVPFFGQLMRLPQLFAYLVQVDSWMREYRVTLA